MLTEFYLPIMDEQSEASKRLAFVFNDQGWTQEEIAKELGYKDHSVVNLYINGKRPISEKFLSRLQQKKGISMKYILHGVGPVTIISYSRDDSIPELNEPLEPWDHKSKVSTAKLNMWWVPAKAQAGFIRGFKKRSFPSQIERGSMPAIRGECFAFEVEGFSMYPDYLPGSYVVCTLLEDISWLRKAKTYVFQTVDGITVKVYNRIADNCIHLSATNNSYNPVEPIPLSELQQLYTIEFNMSRPK